MATVVKTAAGNILIDSKVNVNEKIIADIIRAITQNSMKHIMQTVTNRIVARTLPNNPRTGKNPSKKGVNALRRRIKDNITPKDFLQTYPNYYGKPIWENAEGATSLPVIVVKKYRGRPSKGRKINQPDKVYKSDELVKHIRENTFMKRKNKASMRVRNDKSKFVWTTRSELQKAMKKFQERAGNDIFGWNSLAEIAGSQAITRSINKGNFDAPGGESSFNPSTFSSVDLIRITAKNQNSPDAVTAYNQNCINKMIPQWVGNAIKSEIRFITSSKLLRGVQVPSDVVIKMI